MKKIAIFGSTGSIGSSLLKIIKADQKNFKIELLTANKNYKKLIKSCDIGLSTVIIKKSLIKNLRFPNLKTKEDYVLWLEIAKNGKIIHALNTKLTQWRKSKNSLSSSVVRKLTDGYYVYRHYLKLSVIKSLYSLLVLSINFLNKTK